MIKATWQDTTADTTFAVMLTGKDKRILEEIAVAWDWHMSEVLERLLGRALRMERQAIALHNLADEAPPSNKSSNTDGSAD